MEKTVTDFLAQWPLLAAAATGGWFIWKFQGKLDAAWEARSDKRTTKLEETYGARITKLETRVGSLETVLGEGHDMSLDLLDGLPSIPENVPSRRIATALAKKLGDVKP